MLKCWLLSMHLLLFVQLSKAQQNLIWKGDTTNFIRFTDAFYLQMQNAGVSELTTSWACTDSLLFSIRFNLGFAPSNNNYLEWNLTSENDTVHFRVGETGSNDGVDLNLNGQNYTFHQGEFGSGGTIDFEVFQALDSIIVRLMDDEILKIAHSDSIRFTLKSKYTSSNSSNFVFDNIQLYKWIPDVSPPQLLHWFQKNDTLIYVFDEIIVADSFYCQQPIDQFWIHDTLLLIVPDDFGDFALDFELSDALGNLGSYETAGEIYHWKIFDLIVSEVMLDPIPSAGLVEQEYLELKNQSPIPFYFSGLSFTVGDNLIELPDTFIPPNGFYLFNSDDLPALNNNGVAYKLQFNNLLLDSGFVKPIPEPIWKAEGGWSLIRQGVENLCFELDNWAYSNESSGGSPGYGEATNSESNLFASASCLGDSVIIFESNGFFETLQLARTFESATIENKSHYKWHLTQPLQDSEELDVSFDGCGDHRQLSFQIGKAYAPQVGDLIFTEILPKATLSEEYIELYNTSDHYLKMQGLFIGKLSNENLSNFWPFPDWIFPPKTYVSFSKDTTLIANHFNSGNLFLADLFTITNDTGTIVLWNSNEVEFDRINYSEKQHHYLIADPQDISLERVSINETDQWTSATFEVGYGTPGLPNSRNLEESEDQKISVSEWFCIDCLDASNELKLEWQLEQGNWQMDLQVFSEEGRLVKSVAMQKMIGNQGQLLFDAQELGIGNIGNYVLVLQLFDHTSSKSFRFQRVISCVYAN